MLEVHESEKRDARGNRSQTVAAETDLPMLEKLTADPAETGETGWQPRGADQQARWRPGYTRSH